MPEQPAALPHNLPRQLTQFIGRQREIDTVKRMLLSVFQSGREPDTYQPDVERNRSRLVTLTGVGGCGKTRLAIEVAGSLVMEARDAGAFGDGVWFVDFTALSNPARVARVVGSVFNLRENSDLTPTETLVLALQSKHLLLLLDNCEHLLFACAKLVETLLLNCPEISILATSRAALGILGEAIFPLPPMEFLNPNDQLPVSNLVQSESVRLFVNRAVAVRPNFTLTEPQVRAVTEICRQLDGLPLAIELVAARIMMLTPQQIAGRLDDIFRLMRSRSSTAVERHQTLEAAFDWSHDLLAEPERVLFRRLSVFAGGWTLNAAEQVANFPALSGSQIFDLHEQLLQQSLIIRMDDWQGKRARYRMLEPIRQYAANKLTQTGETDQLSDHHLEYFTQLSEVARYKYLTIEGREWLKRIEAEIGNIREALAWSLAGGQVEMGLRMVSALFHFWLEFNHVFESLEITENLLAHPDAAEPTQVRANTLAFQSLSYLRVGDYQRALISAAESLSIAEKLPDMRIEAYALAGLGHAEALKGNLKEAIEILEKSLALFRGLEDVSGCGWTLSRLGTVALMMGDYKAADSWLSEMAGLMQENGNLMYLIFATRYWGYARFYQGDYEGARIKFRKLFVDWELDEIKSGALSASAMLAIACGQIEEGAMLLGAADAILSNKQAVLLPYDEEQHERVMALIRAYMNDEAVRSAWNTGHELTKIELVKAALAILDSLEQSPLPAALPAGMTPREVDVLRLLAQSMTNQQIADQLVISVRTVHAHLRSIFAKLGVTNRTAAVNEAVRLKIF